MAKIVYNFGLSECNRVIGAFSATGGVCGWAMTLGNFQPQGGLLIWIIAGQGLMCLQMGFVWIFFCCLSYLFFSLSLSFWETLDIDQNTTSTPKQPVYQKIQTQNNLPTKELIQQESGEWVVVVVGGGGGVIAATTHLENLNIYL